MANAHTFFRFTPRRNPKLVVFIVGGTALLIFVLFFAYFFAPLQMMFPVLRQKTPEDNLGGKPEVMFPTPAPYPVNASGIVPGGEVSAGGVIVLDVPSHMYLYKRNEDIKLSPASTTKLLTALVALDAYKPDDVITIKTNGSTGQVMGLVPGERITVENLLYGALIQSGNDAALALASEYPGGYDKFIEAMNVKAKSLFMVNSNFTNPAGYDNPEHKVTPLDLAMLALAAIENKTIAKMVAIPQITVSDVTHTYFHKLANVNQLVGKIPGVAGIKTGWTEQAGENLMTYVERDGRRVIFIVLHSRDRFGDTTKLISWVFDNFRWDTISPL